jgi:hypothetical protein
MARRSTKTQVAYRLAKVIEAQQATPLHSHVNPNDQSALRISATMSATGDAIIDAICSRIRIMNDIGTILELGMSHLEVQGARLKVGSQRLEYKGAQDNITACTQHWKKPVGSRLSDNEKNEARDVAKSFFSGCLLQYRRTLHRPGLRFICVPQDPLTHRRQQKEEQRQARPEK